MVKVIVLDSSAKEKKRNVGMRTPKRWKAFLLALSALAAVFLAGCQKGEDFPVYQMEMLEDHSEILYIDGVQYRRDRSKAGDEQASYYNDGDQYVWTPAEGIGHQIGICGQDSNKGYGWAIYQIAGDEEQIFLYTAPRKFYSGGVESRLWMQKGVTLGAPATEMISSITIVPENGECASTLVNAPAMIVALLDVYNNDSVRRETDFKKDGDWLTCSLIMRHKDFAFLQYEIECCYSPEKKVSYCQNASGEWFIMPTEWVKVLPN